MTLTFSYADGALLPFKQGLPDKFPGTRWTGAKAQFAAGSFGQIITQQVKTSDFIIRENIISWHSPRRLRCDDQADGVLFRMITVGYWHEQIKGMGEIQLNPDQGMIMAVNGCTGILENKSTNASFVDIICSPEFLQRGFGQYEWMEAWQRVHKRVPDILTECMINITLAVKDNIKHIVTSLKQSHVDVEQIENRLTNIVHNIYHIERQKSHNKTFNSKDARLIKEAGNLIADNLDQHLSIQQISQLVGINEFKLKKNFPLMFGRSPFDYRMYLLCLRARNRILSSDEPLKSFHREAGYKRMTSFTTAFRKHLCCTPGELKRPDWNLDE